MTFYRIFTEVTGGSVIGIILSAIFFIIFFLSSFYIIKKYNSICSVLRLSLLILILFLISMVLSDVLIKFLLFPDGEYINHGLGGGLFRLFLAIILGPSISLVITKVVYFNRF
jgi:hypothetical protein